MVGICQHLHLSGFRNDSNLQTRAISWFAKPVLCCFSLPCGFGRPNWQRATSLTICVFFVLLLYSWTKINDWKKKLQKFSFLFKIEWTHSFPIKQRESTWTIFQLLVIFLHSIFCFTTLILERETLSENLLDEVCRNTEIPLDCWDTIIVYVIWATWMVCQSFGCSDCDVFFKRTINLKSTFN